MDDQLKHFLNKKVTEYNTPAFIKDDPISIPHRFTLQQDIEIAGFFAAVFAWGNRKMIINKTSELLQRMDNAPYDFIRDSSPQKTKSLIGFKHRTFNDTDLLYFVDFFQHHYNHYHSLEDAFTKHFTESEPTVENALNGFYHYFFSLPYAPPRTRKHIASPQKASTCKRLNMYLRWMVRKDNKGVDFGIWKNISPAQLICPIDLHVGRVARKLNMLHRKQTDWTAALELTDYLKKMDSEDPAKYDFALFGLGVVEKF